MRAAAQTTGATLEDMEDLARDTHSFMVRHPYHMRLDPWAFREFSRLNIADIVGYKYLVESACLTLRDGQLVRAVKKRDEYRIACDRRAIGQFGRGRDEGPQPQSR